MPNNHISISQIQAELKSLAEELGADLVGFCSLKNTPINTPANTSADTSFNAPVKELPTLTYAISVAVKLSDAVLKTIDQAPSFMYFQHYRTANTLLDSIAFRMARKIEEYGYLAMPVAASQSLGKNNPYRGVIPHKTVAALSGLGFVGKSGLFLTEKYGSKVRFATILTSLPMQSELPVIENGCGECVACQRACPAGAIFGTLPTKDGERNFDPEKCSHYMKEHFQDVGRGSVCGICIKVCPKNKL